MKRLSVFSGIASVCYSLIASDAILPADNIPMFDDVDVVVVGGTSGGVSAAVSAAKSGARVFLISERSFLGEDICSAYRLWLEPTEKPLTELAKEVFKPVEISKISIGSSLLFTYKADKSTTKVHPDTTPPRVLCDGKWKSAASESVQYDDDVNIIVELKQSETIGKVHLLVYQRVSDFEVSRVLVSYSDDANSWKPLTEIKNKDQGTGNYEGEALDLNAKVQPIKAKYLKFSVFKSNDAKRMLLGEIVVEKQAEEKVSQSISAIRAVTPMQVKRTYDHSLIDAGVKFLFWSYPIDIIRDSKGNPAGIVIANRSGKQAILAKVIIDATMHNVVAKMAGVKFTSFEPGTQEFYRVVVGGEPEKGENIQLIKRQPPVVATGRKGETYPVYEYKILVHLDDNSFSSLAIAEQMARDWTLTTNCVDSSEVLFAIPQQTFKGQKSVSEWNGAENFPVECFQPEGMSNLFVLSAAADVPKQVASKLSRPVNIMAIGERIGKVAFENSKNINLSTPFKVVGRQATNPVRGEVRFTEQHSYHRLEGSKSIAKDITTLPVIGEYDVVVVGGGTGGAPGAIAAGRQGVRTLLIEHLYSLGGVGTAGLISSYYFGNRVGFTKEIDLGVAKMSGLDVRTSSVWMPDIKSEWYRKELRKAGVDIWFGTFGSGVLVESNKVKGVVVSTPMGTGIVLAKVVIDSTGNADIAAAAGAKCTYTDDTEIAIQGAGLPQREPRARYINTDFTFIDDSDIVDIWRVFVSARDKFKWAYDLSQLIDTRERRQIVGDYTLTPMDMMLKKTFRDTIVIAKSNFDTHGYTIHPIFFLRPPGREEIAVRVPYRSLLPQGLYGIIVTGLGVSAHRDALPVIRMQPDIQNQGYAAGVAAAMIAKNGISTRGLNIRELQKHLVEKEILPKSILTEEDSPALPVSQIADAVQRVTNNYEKLEIILEYQQTSIPLLEKALKSFNNSSARLIYAHILAILGSNAGIDVLIEKIKNSQWDKGWRYTGMGQFGPSSSPLDSYIIAAGKTRDKRAIDAILEKAEQLQPSSEFSHFRAVALALEYLNDSRACPVLAKLLQMPGISGNAVTDIKTALIKNPPSGTDTTTRNAALTELVLARALYRCGDYQGIGEKVLKQYSQDLHGHYARHAAAVLKSKRM